MSRAPVHCDYQGACTAFRHTMTVFKRDVEKILGRKITMAKGETPSGMAQRMRELRRFGKGFVAPYRGQPGPPIGPRGYDLPPEMEEAWRDLRAAGRSSVRAARDLHLRPKHASQGSAEA